MLEEMLAEAPRDSTRAYNVLLNACAKARKWEHAQKLFQVYDSFEIDFVCMCTSCPATSTVVVWAFLLIHSGY